LNLVGGTFGGAKAPFVMGNVENAVGHSLIDSWLDVSIPTLRTWFKKKIRLRRSTKVQKGGDYAGRREGCHKSRK
jgi:hypothetical protein